MPEDISKELGEFFDSIWRDTEGYVYLPTNHKGVQWTKYMYAWPRQRAAVIKHVITQNSLGNDVHYAMALFKEPRPDKDAVKGTWVFWTDFDHGKAPQSWPALSKKHNIPEPTMRISSSVEGNEHAYWQLSSFVSDVEQIESRNRALAYTFGADTGGWDADQVLRPPLTRNYGYGPGGARKDWYTGDSVPVRITYAGTDRVNQNIFNPLGTPENIIANRIELGSIPDLSEVLMAGRWPEDFRTAFNRTLDEVQAATGRSDALAQLGYFGAENGFTDEQIYVIVKDADIRWGRKYADRHNADKYYLDIIARARAKHGYLSPDELSFDGLLPKANDSIVVDSKLVYNFEEFMNLEVNIDWFLDGLLRNEGVGIVTGPPGVGKTQLIIQAGAHLALGRDWLGWENKTSPKKVLFLSLEMGVVPLKIFWNSITRSYSTVIRDLARNFNIAPIGEGIPLDRPEGQALVEMLMKEYQPDILLIDSLQKVTSKELTDELSVRMFLEYLDKTRLKYHSSMIFIHHNRKKPNGDNSRMADLNDMYGSNYIAANVDFVLNLYEVSHGILGIDTAKMRLGPKRPAFEIIRDENLYFTQTTEISFEGLLHGRNDVSRDADPGSGGPGNKPPGLGSRFSF